MANRPILKDRYRLEQKLGQGAMGEVYLATDLKENEPVAIKTISKELYDEEKVQKRFAREAAALRKIDHPNVIRYIDTFVVGKRACLVMEYVSGGTLSELIKDRKGFDDGFFKQMATGIIEGLAVAHEAGIIHRDLKPSNILLTATLEPVIADFGLAKVADLSTMTSSGTTLGTVVYMPPEAFDTLRKTDHRADIWSLGVIFFQMLTGTLPFRGESQVQFIGAILREEPYPLTLHRRDLPATWEMMISQCLEKDPENRFQSVREIMNDLNELPRVRRDSVTVNRDDSEYEFRFIDVTMVGDELVHQPKAEFAASANQAPLPQPTEALDLTERWAPKEGAKNKTSLEILIISSIFVWAGIVGVFGGALISVLGITELRDEIGVSDGAVQGMLVGGSLLFIIGVAFEAVADAKYRYVLFALSAFAMIVWFVFFSGLVFPEDLKTFSSFLGTMMYIVVLLGYFQFRRT